MIHRSVSESSVLGLFIIYLFVFIESATLMLSVFSIEGLTLSLSHVGYPFVSLIAAYPSIKLLEKLVYSWFLILGLKIMYRSAFKKFTVIWNTCIHIENIYPLATSVFSAIVLVLCDVVYDPCLNITENTTSRRNDLDWLNTKDHRHLHFYSSFFWYSKWGIPSFSPSYIDF